jgi:hypothetical protein
MRNKLTFVVGVGLGYVLGTRAGREKFDQMVAQARRFWDSPTVQEAAGVVQAQATKLYDDGKQVVTEQMHRFGHRKDDGDMGIEGMGLDEADLHEAGIDDTGIGMRPSKEAAQAAASKRGETRDTAAYRSQFSANSF